MKQYQRRETKDLGAYADENGNVDVKQMLADTVAVAKIAGIDRDDFIRKVKYFWKEIIIMKEDEGANVSDVGNA